MMCAQINGCPFYNDKLPMDSGIGSIYKKKYCLGHNAICARYIVFQALGPEQVPDTLNPGMLDVAHRIIKNAGNTHIGESE